MAATHRSARPFRPWAGRLKNPRWGDRQLEGCDFLHHDDNGAIDEFYVMVRPLSGALALAGAMNPINSDHRL